MAYVINLDYVCHIVRAKIRTLVKLMMFFNVSISKKDFIFLTKNIHLLKLDGVVSK